MLIVDADVGGPAAWLAVKRLTATGENALATVGGYINIQKVVEAAACTGDDIQPGPVGMHEHRWFSGRMLACHAGGPGSIPGRCTF